MNRQIVKESLTIMPLPYTAAIFDAYCASLRSKFVEDVINTPIEQDKKTVLRH